jgi:cobalt-zinc-cadmium efflux system membrane fusion protein
MTLLVVNVSLGCGMLLGVSGCRHRAEGEQQQHPTANIKVETVHAINVVDALEVPGRVEVDPSHQVHIYAPLSGRLLDLRLTPGQEVRKGQTIATLQSGDVAQARADFEKARIETSRADRALDRGKLLLAHEVLSQADFQDLKATDDSAHAEQERTRQRIRELGFNESGTTDVAPIASPITGTVLDVNTGTGELQRSLDNSSGMATVANLDTVWVTGDIFERDLAAVKLHQPVVVRFPAYPGEDICGTVAMIGDSLDPNTHAVKLRVVLNNPQHRFKPGMFATLRIERAQRLRVIVPTEAVLHNGSTTEVYVPAGDRRYVEKQVTTGAEHGKTVEIISGLSDGDRVVTQGAAFLRQPAGD